MNDCLWSWRLTRSPSGLFVRCADNLAANFSRELADYIIYVIDVAGGDKIPRKGGPGITQVPTRLGTPLVPFPFCPFPFPRALSLLPFPFPSCPFPAPHHEQASTTDDKKYMVHGLNPDLF